MKGLLSPFLFLTRLGYLLLVFDSFFYCIFGPSTSLSLSLSLFCSPSLNWCSPFLSLSQRVTFPLSWPNANSEVVLPVPDGAAQDEEDDVVQQAVVVVVVYTAVRVRVVSVCVRGVI